MLPSAIRDSGKHRRTCVGPFPRRCTGSSGRVSDQGAEQIDKMDGVPGPDQVAATVLAAVAAEQFLILPHPDVATYERRRADDRERWLHGMRRMQARLSGKP
jgi:hypothetical protein